MERIWKPSVRQEAFLSIPDAVSEALFGGAAGGGKSETLLMLPIARRFYEHPRFKGILFRRTFPELEKSLILRSESDGFYKGTGAEYNRQLRRWKWPSGAIMDFGYAEHENDVRKYDTTEYNFVGWDELTSFTEFQYMYITMSRMRTSDSNLPVICRAGSNPGNIGHGWVRKRFVEPAPYGTIIIDKASRQKRIFIQSLPTDNPYLMAADPDYVRRLDMLPEAEKRAKLYGDWWTFSGQVFDDWRVMPFADEPSNAQHVIPAFEIPTWWPKVVGVDWGFTAMMWAGWAAAAPTGRAYMYREYTATQTKIAEWAPRIARFSQGDNLVDEVLDPSAWNQTGTELTIAEQVRKLSGLNFRRADNDRLSGKTLMQEYLRWKPKPAKTIPPEGFDPETAESIRRWKGQLAFERYVDAFLPEPPETNLPKLQVFGSNPVEECGTCPEFIKTIPLCVYNTDTNNRVNKEDVAPFDGDDPYDGGRYLFKAIDRYYSLARKTMGAVEEREKIVMDFKQTGDYTSLHRRMETFERKQGSARQPMRRFHRAPSNPRPF